MAYHDEYVERISAAIDGALSPAQQAELEAHLATCPHCQALYDDLNRIHQTLRALPTVAVPEGLSERIIAAVQADNVTPITVKKPAFQWKRWAATAAVLALILAGAGGLGLLSGREVMSPATGEAPTPEAIDPAMTRALPKEATGAPNSGDLPSDDGQDGVTEEQNPISVAGLPTQGGAVIPVPTAEPTFVPAQSNPSTPPNQAPEEAEETPTNNFSVGPLGQMPIIPVPSTSATPDGQEDETAQISVQGISLEPEMTEEALAAMERLRLHLELPDGYVWEDAVTCLWADEGTTLRLTYLGLDSGGLCHIFDFSENSVLYLVPVEGGEIITAEP